MNFGICSFAYRWKIGRPYYRPEHPMMIPEFLDKVASFDVKHALLCNNFDWQTMSESKLYAIRQFAQERGISLEAGARETKPEAFRRAIRGAQVLGSGILRIVCDLPRSPDPAKDKAGLDALYRCIEQILPDAQKAGISLTLENGPILSHTEIADLIDKFGRESLGACPDSMNCVYSIHRPEEVFNKLAPYANMAHIKDFEIVPKKRGYVIQGVPLGVGAVNFPLLLRYLSDADFKGTAYLELYIDRCEAEEETFDYEEACVRQSVDYAKSLGLR